MDALTASRSRKYRLVDLAMPQTTKKTFTRVLLVTIVTLGDVLPFLLVGRHLQAQGLEVSVATHEHYGAQVEGHGLAFKPLIAAGDLRQFVTDEHAWHPERGVAAAVNKLILPMLTPAFELIEREAVGGDLLILAHPHALGARVAQDRYDLPLWTLCPSAWLFQSVFASQVYPRVKMTLVGNLARPPLHYRLADWAMDRICGSPEARPRIVIGKHSASWLRYLARRLFGLLSDAMFAEPVNALRHRVGLPAVRGILTHWCHSPTRTVGLFPSWYAEPQRDWPPRHLLTGFVQARSTTPLPEDLRAFLEEGAPPIVVTFGSEKLGNRTAFAQATAACIRLRMRAVFISPDAQDIPPNLTPTIFYAPFAPFDSLFEHAACLVHHGGMGTAAAALRAGVPQILVPFTYDQPDNATRIHRLGVGEIVPPARFKPTDLAQVIERLTTSIAVRARCRRYARLMHEDRALEVLTAELANFARS